MKSCEIKHHGKRAVSLCGRCGKVITAKEDSHKVNDLAGKYVVCTNCRRESQMENCNHEWTTYKDDDFHIRACGETLEKNVICPICGVKGREIWLWHEIEIDKEAK